MWARCRARSACCLLACCLLFAAGCKNCDLVEAELRSRDRDLHEMREELYKAEAYSNALQNELHAVRQDSSAKITPEVASQTYTLKSIKLGRGTGGYDDDDHPGDEALQVIVEPIDLDGNAIKAPGTLRVTALEITPEGLKNPLSTWVIAPEDLRRKWKSGFLTTGYVVVLPWKVWPSTEKLRVIAQFNLADGRFFEADKDVTVRLAPKGYRKAAPAETLDVPLEGPAELGPPLPMPRKVEPPAPEGPRQPLPPPKLTPTATQPAALWQPVSASPLYNSVQLLRPIPLKPRQ